MSRGLEPWSFLPPRLREAALRLKFSNPTTVQAECLPAALRGESFLAVAPTGTGKTLVYLLTFLPHLPSRARNLVLVPTRELAYQVSQMFQDLAPLARQGLVLCVGGHDRARQQEAIQSGWHTLIATPGRLQDTLTSDPDLLKSVKTLVLDEFDRLIALGFENQIAEILTRCPTAPHRQTLLFSATGAGEALDRLPLGDLQRKEIRAGKSAALTEQFYFLKSNKKKGDLLLGALAQNKGQAIVFVSNREKANHLNGLLRLRGFTSEALHGDRLQTERARAYQGFKDGKFPVLVATDLAARGLDVPSVDLVINFDMPRNYRDYVHRSGRTARRSRPGTCLTFAGPDDFIQLQSIENDYGGPLPLHPDFAKREIWLPNARRAHATKVSRKNRAEEIRVKQGIAKP